jgi:hypothetical protein
VSRKKALIKGIIRAKFRINQTFSNDKSEINSRAGKIRENTKLIRSGFKTSDQVQGQGVPGIGNGVRHTFWRMSISIRGTIRHEYWRTIGH